MFGSDAGLPSGLDRGALRFSVSLLLVVFSFIWVSVYFDSIYQRQRAERFMWQADREQSGTGTVGGLEWVSATAGANHESAVCSLSLRHSTSNPGTVSLAAEFRVVSNRR